MTVRFSASARQELLESALYLEQQEPGLGDRFMGHVERAANLIEQHPNAWSRIGRDLRRCRLVVFPYGLIYRIRADGVEIIAVAHDARRPGYWRSRLENEE